MDKIVGTAGHIDHGKTALVKALTGVDTDRLPEEKRRGITIDLGFAEMKVGDRHFGFVDVPGHEKFVRNMLAGASGIDIVLLVVAADEGVMPQTREHFDICRLLDIRTGVIVLTKSDLVDSDTLDLAKFDVDKLVTGSFLDSVPVVAVSSKNDAGIDEVRTALAAAASSLTTRNDDLLTRLPIDRSFSVKGFGTVVTGTLASGSLTQSSQLELLPDKIPVRIRGIQSHGSSTALVNSGARTAVNLGNIDYTDIERGMMLANAGALLPVQVIDTEIEMLTDAKVLRSRQRVRLHIGTAEILARVQVLNDVGEIAAGHKDLVQIRLESPIVAIPGERFIIRSYSPQRTIGGGRVLDAFAVRYRKKDFTQARERLIKLINAFGDNSATLEVLIASAAKSGLTRADLRARTALREDVLNTLFETLIGSNSIRDCGGTYLSAAAFNQLMSEAEIAVHDFHAHDPHARGMSLDELREKVFAFVGEGIFDTVAAELGAGSLTVENNIIRVASHETRLSVDEEKFRRHLLSSLSVAKLEVPRIDEVVAAAATEARLSTNQANRLLKTFLDTGDIVKISEEFWFTRSVIDDVQATIKKYADTTADRLIDVSKFKELVGVSRKYAIPLLEYFDRVNVTRRVRDKRIILK